MKAYYILTMYYFDGTKQRIKLPSSKDFRDYIDCSVVRFVLS